MFTVKKIALAGMLVAASMGAQADLVTNTQTQTFVGTAGSDSSSQGVSPFVFDKFDSALGSLTGVFVNYSFLISGGLIGADNLTNDITSGTGELGASLLLESNDALFIDDNFATIFSLLDLSEQTSFTLAADPSLTTGGNGPDVVTLNGTPDSFVSPQFSLSPFVFSDFTGAFGDTLTVNFNSGSTTIVDVPGAQGFFQAVDMTINFELYYTYVEPVVQPPADVSVSLGAGLAGIAMLGMAGFRRKKN